MKLLLSKFLCFTGIWMILASISELLFYEVHIDSGFYILFLLYGLYGYLMLLLISKYDIRNFAWFFITWSIFGFLIEWWLVGILYESLPFSLIWTSLAWHALISIVLFFYFFRKIFLEGSYKKIFLYSVFLWFLLWLWASYSWNAWWELASGEILFEWRTPWIYISQLFFWYTIFLLWHIMYDYCGKSIKHIWAWEEKMIYWLVGLSFLMWNGIIYFPYSLVLIPLVYICYTSLWKSVKLWWDKDILMLQKVPENRYLTSIIIPIIASFVYIWMYAYNIEIEMNAAYFLLWGFLSLYLFFNSLYKLYKA